MEQVLKAYMENLLAWAEPYYRFVFETAVELAVLAMRAARRLLRPLLAAILFLPWLLWLRHRKGGG